MKQALIVLLASIAILATACKKKAQAPCPEAFSENQCESMKDREYPLLDISQDPAAWYRATIEDQESTVGVGYEDLGFSYSAIKLTKFVTTEPILNPSNEVKENDFYSFDFSLYRPSQDLVGKSFALLSFNSPGFDSDTIVDPFAFATELFSPGIKQVSDGFFFINGWDIKMLVFEKIETRGQTAFGGSALLYTSSALQPVEGNYFEITQTTTEDLGPVVRFTIWCKFDVQMYQKRFNPTMGLYFGPVEQGTAKLYVDVAK
jgi:hypothetical protein